MGSVATEKSDIQTRPAEDQKQAEEYEFKIDTEFLEKCLKKKVKNFQITPGSNTGDNYLSILHAIEVEFADKTEKNLHLMLKAFPGNVARHAGLHLFNCFYKEVEVYRDLLPRFLRYQDKLRGAYAPFYDGFAVDYTKPLDPNEKRHSFLLMTNVKKSGGFTMANRIAGLDLEHAKLVIVELAKIHAISWGFVQKVFDGSEMRVLEHFPYLSAGFFHPNNDVVVKSITESNVNMLLPLLEEILVDDKKHIFSHAKDTMTNGFLEHAYKICASRTLYEQELESSLRIKPTSSIKCKEPWNVVLHGDCWLNNFLFNYDEKSKKPKEMILVDLQGFNLGCPTVDLVYFIYSSLSTEVRRAHLDSLLSLYTSSFLEFCDTLKVEPLPGFSEETLKRRFHRSKRLGLCFASVLLPIIMSNPEDCQDLEKLETKEGSTDLDFLTDMVAGRATSKDSPIAKRFSGIVIDLYEQGVI